MTSYLRKCVSPGAPGPLNPPSPYSLLWKPDGTYRNLRYHANTTTPWVRLWASWRWLMPYDENANPATDTRPYAGRSYPNGVNYAYVPGSPADYVRALDQQIDLARSNPYLNLNVILTFWEFPLWANGMYDKDPSYNPYGDRGGKQFEFRTPADVGSGSPFRRALEFLVACYKDKVYFLEIMNEPNLQWWPQRGNPPDSAPLSYCTATSMFQTAQAVHRLYGSRPRLMGPATSDDPPGFDDSASSTRARLSYRTFMGPGAAGGRNLLDGLAGVNFQADQYFAWTHHNYADVLYDLGDRSERSGTGPGQTNAHDARERLKYRWTGWPYADAANPYLMLTEGGGVIDAIIRLYNIGATQALDKQANLLTRNWKRMKGDADPAYSAADAPGIGMITNYLWHTSPDYDSGLRNQPPDVGFRPAYSPAWANMLPAY